MLKKFDVVNPVIGEFATQVKSSKLTDNKLKKKLLGQGETINQKIDLNYLKMDQMISLTMMMKVQVGVVVVQEDVEVGEEGEGVETMELHQGRPQIYTAETVQQKIQDELLKIMIKDFKIKD